MSTGTPPPRPPLSSFLQGPAPDGEAEATPVAAETEPAQPAEAPETPEAVQESPDAAPLADEQDLLPAAATEDQPAPPEATETTPDAPTTAAEPAVTAAPAAPSFLLGPRPAPVRTPRWQWGLATVLGAVLLLQIAIADRARFAAHAGTRPLVGALCKVVRCTLPAWHEPAAFTMLQREVRPLPGRAGALLVQASFRNDARWEQDWPALRLSLSDADGRVIGRRTLLPADYLGPAHDPAQRLAPGQSAQVAFHLREPAAGTVAYSFEFR